MKTAAIYARVSSDKQKSDQTIASQTAALKEYADSLGLVVPADWIFEDEGFSGATLVRPALERLRDIAAQVHIEVLLCYSPDRLARKYAYQALLIEELSRVGTEVRFLKGAKAETPEDELLLQFQGMIAEYERAQIAERTRRGKAHKAKTGLVSVLSCAPYGYRYIRKADDIEARYEIVEPQASVVREVFRRYTEENLSIGALARWLSASGIPTASGKAKWDRSVVWAMLRNPAYCGRAAFAKTMRTDDQKRVTRPLRLKGHRTARHRAVKDRPREQWMEIAVPAIISDAVFALAARQLEDNKRFAARRTIEPTLLQGLVVCRNCGYAYYRTSTRTSLRKIYYYRCLGSDDYRWENGRVCQNIPVRQDYLDDLVWGHLITLLSNPNLVLGELERRLRELRSSNPVGAQKSRIELDLSRVTTAMERLVVAYQEELLSLDELRRRMPDLRKKEASLRAGLQALEARVAEQETYLRLAENLDSFLSRLRDAAASSSIQERQRIVRLLIKEVLVDPERVVIRHCIPLPRSDEPPGYLLRGRRHDPSLRCSRGRVAEGPLLHHTRLQPLVDTPAQHPVAHPLVQEAPELTGIQVVVEALDVGLQDPAPIHLRETFPQGPYRLMRRSAGPEAIRAVLKVLLVDRFQHHRDRPLEDFVLEGGHPDRPLDRWVTPFRDVDPANWRRFVAARLEAVQEASKVLFEVLFVGRPGLTVYSRRTVFARPAVGFPQKVHVDVVSQAHEDPLRVLLRQLCYPLQFR
jgi:site-specific DNA recombinase